MYFKGARAHEALRTLIALEWSFPRVASEMVRQVSMRGKGPATALKRTLERLLAIVNAHVRLQVALFSESLATVSELTYERLRTIMGSLVDFEASCA